MVLNNVILILFADVKYHNLSEAKMEKRKAICHLIQYYMTLMDGKRVSQDIPTAPAPNTCPGHSLWNQWSIPTRPVGVRQLSPLCRQQSQHNCMHGWLTVFTTPRELDTPSCVVMTMPRECITELQS